jgi:hypothetical protein
MKRSKLAAVILVGLVVVTALAALAQEEVAGYVVRSSSAANARSCPRLDCAVVTTFGPGEIISVVDTVSGDTVSGSDQWHRVVHDGANVYVHSSLLVAQPSDKSAPALAASVTDQWVEHQCGWSQHQTPHLAGHVGDKPALS